MTSAGAHAVPVATTPPDPKRKKKKRPLPKRLTSLDAYRGFIMTMLAASGFGIAKLAGLPPENEVWTTFDYDAFERLQFHFTHPPWVSIVGVAGVSFWDLIQPCFMFMVGVAMPFSYSRREQMGRSSARRTLHALWRAIVLVLLGVFLYSLSQPRTNWIFTNVLAQIGLGYFFVYLLLRFRPAVQLGAVAAILVGYWGLFVLNPPPADYDYAAVGADPTADGQHREVFEGRFAPWSKNAHVGHFFDVWLLNQLRSPTEDGQRIDPPDEDDGPLAYVKYWWFSSPERFEFNKGGYVTLNFVPSMATMLLGVLCGQLLLSNQSTQRKILLLLCWAAISLTLGVLAHHSVCPIVKRIWTPSWALFSGGYAIGLLVLFYLLFDVLPLQKLAFPLVVVGMNGIVMYMLGQMLRPWVTNKVVQTHFGNLLVTIFGPSALSYEGLGAIILPTAAFVVFWLIAFWMYRNRYFVRI